ncbi:MAG: toll/interleukin-1 receptor domain-containing protein [Promethearchaeota archaeon]
MMPFKPYQGSEPFIFVSYSHKDNLIVFPEIRRLQEAGYRIWYDEGIIAATKMAEAIPTAIDQSAFFLVFISPNSV